MPENEDAYRIFAITSGQVIMSGGMDSKVIDINHMAVWEAIDRYHVENPVRCFERVLMLFHYFRK